MWRHGQQASRCRKHRRTPRPGRAADTHHGSIGKAINGAPCGRPQKAEVTSPFPRSRPVGRWMQKGEPGSGFPSRQAVLSHMWDAAMHGRQEQRCKIAPLLRHRAGAGAW